jgi:hypothetical protein
MAKKILTRNILLLTECETCNLQKQLDLQELRDYGEGNCDDCGDIMILKQEALIIN